MLAPDVAAVHHAPCPGDLAVFARILGSFPARCARLYVLGRRYAFLLERFPPLIMSSEQHHCTRMRGFRITYRAVREYWLRHLGLSNGFVGGFSAAEPRVGRGTFGARISTSLYGRFRGSSMRIRGSDSPSPPDGGARRSTHMLRVARRRSS